MQHVIKAMYSLIDNVLYCIWNKKSFNFVIVCCKYFGWMCVCSHRLHVPEKPEFMTCVLLVLTFIDVPAACKHVMLLTWISFSVFYQFCCISLLLAFPSSLSFLPFHISKSFSKSTFCVCVCLSAWLSYTQMCTRTHVLNAHLDRADGDRIHFFPD